MIQYTLKCSDGHQFDSWFQSASAFDKLQNAGMLSCTFCGGTNVDKILMAPAVRPARSADAKAKATDESKVGPLSAPASPTEQAIADIREKVEKSSEYVGADFVAKAREMHEGDAPEKSIYGEAKLDDARKLLEEGIPILPLPFGPSRKDS